MSERTSFTLAWARGKSTRYKLLQPLSEIQETMVYTYLQDAMYLQNTDLIPPAHMQVINITK